ncbi:hypothetical protein [Tahibacter amnicola]|uniref:DUF4185 domain-containing protein n=1 Tax=Tahibacter amnicola TaxID=2976241 RepID=A0ABY6B7E5_9GAMM|nr:hypothetical protein [Tahibacter amnicola]UXI65820.1 hypothetical protein N4264_13715 [Tahibacter amnicola]
MDKVDHPGRRRLLQAAVGLGCLPLARLAGATPRSALGTPFPTWRRAMAANTWRAIPAANTLQQIDPARNPQLNPYLVGNPNDNRGPWGGALGQAGVILPWCGACYDNGSGTLWLPLGGGHGDYAGNEAYGICLADEIPQWRMPRPPSGSMPLGQITLADGQEATGNYADGRPRAIHSYNKHVYLPGRGPFCAVQGATFQSGQAGTQRSLLLNTSNGEWEVRTTHPAAAVEYGGACYDATRDAVWWIGAGTAWLTRYDVASNQWDVFTGGTQANYWNYHALTHAPQHDILVMLSAALPQGFAIWDATTAQLTHPGATNSWPAHLGQPGGQAGCQWVPGLNAVALWHNRNVATTSAVTLLRAPADPRSQPWTWDTLPVAAGNTVTPTIGQANGTFGRFGYAPGLDGFYLLNDVDEPVYFFALSDGDLIFANGFEAA